MTKSKKLVKLMHFPKMHINQQFSKRPISPQKMHIIQHFSKRPNFPQDANYSALFKEEKIPGTKTR
jgi:hypothetical protein